MEGTRADRVGFSSRVKTRDWRPRLEALIEKVATLGGDPEASANRKEHSTARKNLDEPFI